MEFFRIISVFGLVLFLTGLVSGIKGGNYGENGSIKAFVIQTVAGLLMAMIGYVLS